MASSRHRRRRKDRRRPVGNFTRTGLSNLVNVPLISPHFTGCGAGSNRRRTYQALSGPAHEGGNSCRRATTRFWIRVSENCSTGTRSVDSSIRDAAGPKVRPSSPRAAISSGRTSRTTASCATTRPTAGQRVPPALRQHQRPHRRPAGAACLLRAFRPPRQPYRVRRLDRHHCRQVAGQALQLAQRRRGEVGRLDLVHRSGLRHRERL